MHLGRLGNSSSSIFINAIITKCFNFNAKVRQLNNPNQNGSVRCTREKDSIMTEAMMWGWETTTRCTRVSVATQVSKKIFSSHPVNQDSYIRATANPVVNTFHTHTQRNQDNSHNTKIWNRMTARVYLLFCGLTKGISLKMCICVKVSKCSFEPFCSLISSHNTLCTITSTSYYVSWASVTESLCMPPESLSMLRPDSEVCPGLPLKPIRCLSDWQQPFWGRLPSGSHFYASPPGEVKVCNTSFDILTSSHLTSSNMTLLNMILSHLTLLNMTVPHLTSMQLTLPWQTSFQLTLPHLTCFHPNWPCLKTGHGKTVGLIKEKPFFMNLSKKETT